MNDQIRHDQIRNKALLIGALTVIGGVVVWSFTLVGSPAFNRRLAADERRTSDLKGIKSGVEAYFRFRSKLPDTLSELSESEKHGHYYGPYNFGITDPFTHQPYEYRVIDPSTYELCATFVEASPGSIELRPDKYRYEPRKWEHGQGRHCFLLDLR